MKREETVPRSQYWKRGDQSGRLWSRCTFWGRAGEAVFFQGRLWTVADHTTQESCCGSTEQPQGGRVTEQSFTYFLKTSTSKSRGKIKAEMETRRKEEI